VKTMSSMGGSTIPLHIMGPPTTVGGMDDRGHVRVLVSRDTVRDTYTKETMTAKADVLETGVERESYKNLTPIGAAPRAQAWAGMQASSVCNDLMY
jgi:hypothetical protein